MKKFFIVAVTVLLIIFFTFPASGFAGTEGTNNGGVSDSTLTTQAPETTVPETTSAPTTTIDPDATTTTIEPAAPTTTTAPAEVTATTDPAAPTTTIDPESTTTTIDPTETTLDTTAPVIILNGNVVINLAKGEAFTDPGATATDNIDASVIVTTSGIVDITKAGTYTLNYNATDAAGNAAIAVTRTVNVPDSTPPVITLNGADVIDLNIGETFTDPGATATDNVDLSVAVTTTGTVNTNFASSYIVSYDATDAAGNIAATVTRTVNVSSIATVMTDKPDYLPTDYVLVTGSGWLPGETVKLDFHETLIDLFQQTNTYYTVADSSGNIRDLQYLIELRHLGAEFILTATGITSGLTAQSMFTDGYENHFYVTYNGNSNTTGSVPTDNTAYHYNNDPIVKSNTGNLTKTGYTFAGWTIASNGSGTVLVGGDSFNITENTKLYAKWVQVTYKVTYNGNSNTTGSVPTDNTSYHYNDDPIVKSNTGSLTKTGYTFAGWTIASNGSGTVLVGGDSFNITENTTLYAKWTQVTYTVTYNGNSNTGGTAPTDGSSPYASGATVTVLGEGTLTKTGYGFTGWNTDDKGHGTSYAIGATFNIGSNTKLYAQWEANKILTIYKVVAGGVKSNTNFTFDVTDKNGFRGTVTVTVSANHSTGQNTIGVASGLGQIIVTETNISGYTVTPSITQTGTGSGGVDEDHGTCGDYKVTFTNTPITYTVTYNGNTNTSGTAPVDGSSPYLSGSTVTVLGNTGSLVKTNYTFAGWNTQADGLGTSYAASAVFAITGNTVLYAKWTPKTYTVTYNGNSNTGGTAPTDGSSPYTYPANVTVLGNTGSLIRTNYSFAGWNTQADGLGTNYAASAVFAITGNTTLYAKWTPNDYSVTYDKNSVSATGSQTDLLSPYTYPADVTVLDAGTIARTNYTFAGWNTQADGLGTNYAELDVFAITANTTLYAKWTPITYTVIYDGNTNTGGTAPVDAISPYLSGSSITVLGAGSLLKTDNTFAGWNTAADGSGTSYAEDTAFNISGNITLYAQWTIIPGPAAAATTTTQVEVLGLAAGEELSQEPVRINVLGIKELPFTGENIMFVFGGILLIAALSLILAFSLRKKSAK